MGIDKADGRTRTWCIVALVLVMLIGLSLRMTLVIRDAHNPSLWGDEWHYESIAHNLVDGRGYCIGTPPVVTAGRTPITPFIVAAVYLTGKHIPVRAQATFAVLDSINVLLVFLLAMMIGRNWLAALLASAMYSLHPQFARMASRILSETPFTTMWLISLMFLLKHWRTRRWRDLVISGIFMGLSALTRPTSVLFPAVIVLLFLLEGRREKIPWIGRAAVYCAVIALVILPWSVRSSLAFKAFVPISTYGGPPLWAGAGPGPHGEVMMGPWEVKATKEAVAKMNEVQTDYYLRREAVRLIVSHPVHWVRLGVGKFFILWFRLFKEGAESPLGILLAVGNLAVLLLTWHGVRVSGDRRLMGLVVGIFLYYTLMHVSSYAELRYSIPAYAYFMPFAAIGLVNLLQKRAPHTSGNSSRTLII